VVQFRATHHECALTPQELDGIEKPLLAWRQHLVAAKVLGQDPMRYQGAGFGNLSARLSNQRLKGDHAPSAQGAGGAFIITATQTGHLPSLDASMLCVVDSFDLKDNSVKSHGPRPPSSESMTHGVIYALKRSIRFVFHGHAPTLWSAAAKLGLASSAESAGYGTPEMAEEFRRLMKKNPLTRAIRMGGHEDGVVVFGESAFEAGQRLRQLLIAARRL